MDNRDEHHVRALATSLRNTVALCYTNHGVEFGRALSRRIVAECAAEAIEVHGRRYAYAMLMRAADRVVEGRLLEDEIAIPSLAEEPELLPGPKAVIATHEASKAERAPSIHAVYQFIGSKYAAFLGGVLVGLAWASEAMR